MLNRISPLPFFLTTLLDSVFAASIPTLSSLSPNILANDKKLNPLMYYFVSLGLVKYFIYSIQSQQSPLYSHCLLFQGFYIVLICKLYINKQKFYIGSSQHCSWMEWNSNWLSKLFIVFTQIKLLILVDYCYWQRHNTFIYNIYNSGLDKSTSQ